jgi:hypothetical protein
MKRKYYTSTEILEYAQKMGATCTFASLAVRVFKVSTNKGQCEVRFVRVEPCVWQKKIVRK